MRLPPIWLWLNLLSLDAPLVAVVWQDFVARCYPSPLLPAGRWALGLTVWAIYLTDRMLDVRHAPVRADTPRHQFYRSHPLFARRLLAAVVAADAVIAVLWLRPAVISNGLLVGAAVGGYLLLFASLKLLGERSKPYCAAVLFTLGVFLVAWTSMPGALALAMPAAAFGALCLGNLLLVQQWEFDGIAKWGRLLLLALTLGFAGPRWYVAIALGGAGLMALSFAGERLPKNVRQVLADVVLLGPLLL